MQSPLARRGCTLSLAAMHFRPVNIWWVGAGLFAPSVLWWVIELLPIMICGDMEWTTSPLKQIYLPFVAALVGLTVPLVSLRMLKNASWCFTSCAFLGYLVCMLSWATLDIRHQHAQGNALQEDFHSRNIYFTWYFVPAQWAKWIEQSSAANHRPAVDAGRTSRSPIEYHRPGTTEAAR